MIYFIKQLCFLGLLSEGQMSKAYKESSQSFPVSEFFFDIQLYNNRGESSSRPNTL